jgi:nitronate monooxygenase
MLCPIDVHEYLDVILEEKVGIVETSGMSLPEELTKEIKAAGLKWMHKCVGPRYAAKAAKLGADAVTVVGWENGGATGNLDLTTMVVVPATREAVEIPVIGGGGIADGRGVAAVLALGADAAIVGTRFVLAEECPVHPAVKEKLLHASSLDTVLVMKAINMTHRVLVNEAAKKVLELDAKQGDLMEYAALCDGKAAARLYFNGELDIGMTYCSQAIGLMNDVRPAAEIVRSMAEEAALILRRYAP